MTFIYTPLAIVASAALFINIPFGFWRARLRRFSSAWFLAVHLPVPLIIALRLYEGIRWRLAALPVLAAAYLLGQYLGGVIYRQSQNRQR